MLYRYITIFIILGASLVGNLPLTPPCWAETLVQSTVDTRLSIAMRVGQENLQRLVPAPLQVNPIPGGPLKEANIFVVFIDSFHVQDPQGKLDKVGVARKVVFAVPAKHTQTGEMVTVVIGGLTADIREVPGPYKNFVHAALRREQTEKMVNVEIGETEDFWEARDDRGGFVELRIHYQKALSPRSKVEQKIYSAVDPGFFRIYRVDQAVDMVKSTPAGIDRVKKYQFRMATPALSNIFDGTEQLIGVGVIPIYVRQIFLP
jgi:hypothetical protein